MQFTVHQYAMSNFGAPAVQIELAAIARVASPLQEVLLEGRVDGGKESRIGFVDGHDQDRPPRNHPAKIRRNLENVGKLARLKGVAVLGDEADSACRHYRRRSGVEELGVRAEKVPERLEGIVRLRGKHRAGAIDYGDRDLRLLAVALVAGVPVGLLGGLLGGLLARAAVDNRLCVLEKFQPIRRHSALASGRKLDEVLHRVAHLPLPFLAP